jgi:phosphoribosylformylglycinamidine cyclo-ligase
VNNVEKMDYKKAGVDIDEGNKLVTMIGPLAAQTARPGAHATLGSFGSIFDLKTLQYHDPLLISSTDGVGTKLKIATALNNHTTIGQDLVAMCVNDILCQGAEPLFFLDYFATGKLKSEQAYAIIAGIADACKKSNCALIGGETAEMPGMYQAGDYDLAGFVVGIVERDHLLPKMDLIQAGDVVIGLESSGPHSNGYSLIRKIIHDNTISWQQPAPFASRYASLGELLLEPTRVYSSAVLPLCKQQRIKGIAHITGGGLLENIPRILPKHLAVEIDLAHWNIPYLFQWIQHMGHISDKEMQRTFNLGIGMVLVVDACQVNRILHYFSTTECAAHVIGVVVPRAEEQPVIIHGSIK